MSCLTLTVVSLCLSDCFFIIHCFSTFCSFLFLSDLSVSTSLDLFAVCCCSSTLPFFPPLPSACLSRSHCPLSGGWR